MYERTRRLTNRQHNHESFPIEQQPPIPPAWFLIRTAWGPLTMKRSRLSSTLPSPRRGFQREALGDQSNSFDKLAEALAPGERAKRPFASLLLMPALLALWLAGGSAVQAVPNPATTPVLYMVATAHLDDQWNWTIKDTINK